MKTLNIHDTIEAIVSFMDNQLQKEIQNPCVTILLDEEKKKLYEKAYGDKNTTKEISDYLLEVNLQNTAKSEGIEISYFIKPIEGTKLSFLFASKQDAHTTQSYLTLIYLSIIEYLKQTGAIKTILKNEAYLTAMIDAVKAGMIAINLSGDIIYANKFICKELKTDKTFFFSQNIRSLIPNWNSIFKMVSAGNMVKNEETFINTSSISLKLNIDVIAINDKHQNKLGFCIIFRSLEKITSSKTGASGMTARYYFKDIIGKSKAMKQVIEYAQTISNSPSTILIEGESGTGKEVFAQSIHNASNRKNNGFVAINCAAIPENLIESELFGYDDGAFTGAKKGGQQGKFELANKGTLFLDEIGDMKPDMQVKLLRAIQESSVTRVGGEKLIPVDVRIIAATNKNLAEEVENGNFRMDLYYRISVIPLHIPSLKERKSDLPSLIRFFLNEKSIKLQKDIPQMGYSMLQQLLDYDWPGNVRELQNFIEQLVNFNGKISLDSFQKLKQEEQLITHIPVIQNDFSYTPSISLKDLERKHIINTLSQHNGNMTKTAKSLEISRNTLYLKLKKYNINHRLS
ncbi:sigma-54 interaction domain-containing protein [Labilibacter marinus]|uniref:sigma-54 interaction domain-containing protein n=1 Tax=Labilibacter marinus TaxID=1477105 RepID=UPI00094F86F2|nr:sigma 54-interacting transcriptional regulator [Labilibacter marinus]